jgi:hypothetical protein
MKVLARHTLVVVCLAAAAVPALAQDSKSAALAKQLAQALEAAKLDSVATKDPANPDTYIGALYIPGAQLLAISAKYTAPLLLDARIGKKEYRDVYIDLNSAGTPGTKVFIEDLGIDGLRSRREDNLAFDSFEISGKRTSFNNDWRGQQLSEQDYLKAFSTADERYAQMLNALLAQLKQ